MSTNQWPFGVRSEAELRWARELLQLACSGSAELEAQGIKLIKIVSEQQLYRAAVGVLDWTLGTEPNFERLLLTIEQRLAEAGVQVPTRRLPAPPVCVN